MISPRKEQLTISNAEKVISLLSYFTMGIAGLIWIIIAHFLKKRLKFFIMYNIVQSMLISVFLALLNILINIILQVLTLIPFLRTLGININMFLHKRIDLFFLSFNKIEIIVLFLLVYISIGVIIGRLFYVPIFTAFTKTIMDSYNRN